MILCEVHYIKKGNKNFEEIDQLSFLSKNLYNSALYEVRQEYFKTKKYINKFEVINRFTKNEQPDYKALPAKISQQTIAKVHDSFISFFNLIKSKTQKRVGIPKYLDKQGRYSVIYTNQAFSKKEIKKGIIHLSKTNIKIKTKIQKEKIQQVILTPLDKECYKIIVIYKENFPPIKPDNNRYASIDLGISNLSTITSNVEKPFIINGNPVKAINQFYNKKKSKLQSSLMNNVKSSKRIRSLTRKRSNKINDYLHKSSTYIVNHLVSNNINTLVVGYNKNWKQETNMGKVNNQKFVSIPFCKFVNMLKYKCEKNSIRFITHEESYTSKCSFLDNEKICKHENYLGKRIKRGLFKTSTKKLINADVNGSLNILKNVVGEFQYPIEACSTPLKITISL